ncbi:MAG: 4'-phosphopantetheinyl transferase family protein [Gemmobacter sp.]
MPDLAALAAALRGLLPVGAAVVATDPRAAHALLPGEAIAAVPRRLREYAAGRTALRGAMAMLGLAQVAIPMNPDRSPALPQGLAASITHTDSVCLAAAMTGPLGLGIDLEPDRPLPPEAMADILTPAEHGTPEPLVVFAAKEALYKAQYPVSRALFGFDAVAITLGPGAFIATFLHDVPGFPAGTRLPGRWCRVQGHILAALVL